MAQGGGNPDGKGGLGGMGSGKASGKAATGRGAAWDQEDAEQAAKDKAGKGKEGNTAAPGEHAWAEPAVPEDKEMEYDEDDGMDESEGNDGKRRKRTPPAKAEAGAIPVGGTSAAVDGPAQTNVGARGCGIAPPVPPPSLYEQYVAWVCYQCRTPHSKPTLDRCRMKSCQAKRPLKPGQESEAARALREKHLYQA